MSNPMPLDPNDQATASVITNALAGGHDWRAAAEAVVNQWCDESRCFSSGEVGAALRTHKPDLRFSVLSVGELLRDLEVQGMLPQYPDDGNGNGPTPPVQVPRTCEGLYPDRTPAGTSVFVYAPNPEAGYDHEFEICIPKPAETQDQVAQAQANPAPITQQPTLHPVAILGAKVATVNLKATVHADGRLCVTRSAFEAMVSLSGTPLHGGDPVFVQVTPNEVSISQQQATGFKSYDLATTRGRVLIPSNGVKFNPGDVFTVQVTQDGILVPLGKTV